MKTNIIFGVHPVKSLLIYRPKFIINIYVASEVKTKLLNKIKKLSNCDIPISIVTNRWLDLKSNNFNHQGIMAEIQLKSQILSYKDLKILLSSQSKELNLRINLILIIEHVTDPRNLGAALRTVDAVGIKIVIISKYNSVPFNNAIVKKTASGMTQDIYIIQVSNLLRVIYLLKKNKFWIIGTSPAVNGNTNLFNHKFIFPMAILFGSEDKGLTKLILKNCDKIIYIPMFGKINSLNISVCLGVVLYEIIRQMIYINR